MAHKSARHCEGCHRDLGARFRTLANLYLCQTCYQEWMQTGTVPLPVVEERDEERVRW